MDIISSKFDALKEVRLTIKQTMNDIVTIKDNVKDKYAIYIEQEKSHYFGLDSFHFQNKAIELEYNHLLELYHFIDNRIYGDYYKLFITIELTLKRQLTKTQFEKINELKHLYHYPVYKDLESLNIYDFELINQIHQDIILIIASINELTKENEQKLKEHQKIMDLGMNIDNYVINQTYLNNSLLNSNQLHTSYLEVYHKYHKEWLTKLYNNIKLFYNQIKQHSTINNTPIEDSPVEDSPIEDSPVEDKTKQISITIVNEIVDKVIEITSTLTPTSTSP